MSDWPVGLSTGCFYQRNILECIDEILHAGFSLVEICSSASHLDYHNSAFVHAVAERLEALGIGAYSFHAPFADHIDITSESELHRIQSVKEVRAAARAASILSVRYFVVHPGPEHAEVQTGSERLRRLDRVAVSLSEIAADCQAMGMTCVLENKLPHLLFGNTADMLWILGSMTVTDVGVCLDTGHASLGGDPEAAIQKLSKHLKLIHASDNNGRFDDHLPPGQGTLNWRRILSTLRKSEFRGSIMMEIAGRSSSLHVLKEAGIARQYLRREAWSLEKAPSIS